MSKPVTSVKPRSLSRLQGFINRTWKSTFVRNVAVATGTAGAQAIVIVFSYLRRSFDVFYCSAKDVRKEALSLEQ